MTKTQANEPGFVLVPREPTEAMETAHFEAHAKAATVFASVQEIWSAMLAAAPIVPAPAYGVKALEDFLRDARSWLDSRSDNARPGWMVAKIGAAEAALSCFSSAPVEEADAKAGGLRTLQARVRSWTLECFGDEIACDLLERMDRFTEESLELVQSLGYTPDRAHALVDYVFGREAGEPSQEVGGTMTTLAALCNVAGIDMQMAFRTEVERITTPAMVEKIRAKQAAKPTGSALPIAVAPSTPSPQIGKAGAGLVGEAVAIRDYARDYEFRCDDGGGYTPTEGERAMIEDALNGFLSEPRVRSEESRNVREQSDDMLDAWHAERGSETGRAYWKKRALKAEALAAHPVEEPGEVERDNETYELGKRDGYEEAVQHIDERTGGNGEYVAVVGGDPEGRNCPDAPAMVEKIVARYEAAVEEISRQTVARGEEGLRAEAAETALTETRERLEKVEAALRETLGFARALEKHSGKRTAGRRGGAIFARADAALTGDAQEGGK